MAIGHWPLAGEEAWFVDEYLKHAQGDMIPKLKGSAMAIIVSGEPDAKLCLEVGAAVLYDKPLVVVVSPGSPCSANLKRCAAAIVEGDVSDPAVAANLMSMLHSVLEKDARARRGQEATHVAPR